MIDRSLVSVIALGVPASLAIAYDAHPIAPLLANGMLTSISFGTVYMFCAVGVYV